MLAYFELIAFEFTFIIPHIIPLRQYIYFLPFVCRELLLSTEYFKSSLIVNTATCKTICNLKSDKFIR